MSDDLFHAISTLIPNVDCDAQALADAIREEIAKQIKAAMVKPKGEMYAGGPIVQNPCYANPFGQGLRHMINTEGRCVYCGQWP